MAKNKKPQGHPARDSPAAPKDGITIAALALVKGSMDAVRRAEREVQAKVRFGEDPALAIEVHHYLRVSALAALVAYSQLAGLPDPRDAAPE